MDPLKTLSDARRSVTDQEKATKAIAKGQQEAASRSGYARSPGFDPEPRAHRTYQPETTRVPLDPSPPLDLSKAGTPKTKKTSFGINE